MKRKSEVIIGLIGVILSVIMLGGFSLTVTTMEEGTYATSVFPTLQEGVSMNNLSESFEAMKTLAVWFGITLLMVLISVVLAISLIWKNKFPKRAAFFYLFAGVATLIGTQMIAFPIAFFFFVASGLCMFRKKIDKEIEYVPNKDY
jgi:hypothetical protein